MKFSILNIFPQNNRGPESYNEVIETLSWGLEQLGYEVSHKKFDYNASISDLPKFEAAIDRGAINIIFGAQILNMPFLEILPNNTIIYNLEQRYEWFYSGKVPDEYLYQAQRFIIWDYSERNIVGWQKIYPQVKVSYVKIGYAPVLEKIDSNATQDIDVLFYGAPTDNRLKVFKDLCSLRLKSVFAYGFFGSDRDNLISRSKVILNMHGEYHDKIFEIVRVSYLLANSKAVVSEYWPDTSVEQDVRSSVILSPYSELANCCRQLIVNNELRHNVEQVGKKTIVSRDIRQILGSAWVPG